MMPMPPSAMPAPEAEGAEMPSDAAAEGGDVKPMLIKILKKVMDTARASGIDFNALVAEVSGGAGMESESATPMPRPPSSAIPM